jgi:uncharacterized protein YegL
MADEYIVRQQDLVENPSARVPICLVLDTSSSMSGAPIRELNEGVQLFVNAILEDETARYAAEVAIVSFGDKIDRVMDFMSIERQEFHPLVANGLTPLGAGVLEALSLLEARKQEYQRAGVDYYQPWMVLMTDGSPTDDISEAERQTRELVEKKKLTVFPIAIGSGADLQTLSRFSPTRPPLRLKGTNFAEFFEWLSKSVSRVSQSTPGETVPLDVDGISAWGSV